jgi:adenylate cyclase class IV
MPDMKSEILKVKETMTLDNLTFDDDDGPTQKLELTNANLYQWITDNPGKSCSEMKAYFQKEEQISTRLAQAVTNGFLAVKKYNGTNVYFRTDKQVMTSEERAVLLRDSLRKYQGEQRASKETGRLKKNKRKDKQDSHPAPSPSPTSEWEVDALVNSLGLKQAKALYEKLKEYFG